MISIEVYAKQYASDAWQKLDVLDVSLGVGYDVRIEICGTAWLRHLAGLGDIALSLSMLGDMQFTAPYFMRIVASTETLDIRVLKDGRHHDMTHGYLSTDLTILEIEPA
jgi:hypothetical protein